MKPVFTIWFALYLGMMIVIPWAQGNWRALVIYTHAVDSVEAQADLRLRFQGIFDEINDTYSDSYIDARTQIAGIIRDTNYSETSIEDTLRWAQILETLSSRHISDPETYPPPPWDTTLVKYARILDKYSADVLIIRFHANRRSAAASIFGTLWSYQMNESPHWNFIFDQATSLGYGVFVVPHDDGWIWAHEAGHIHGGEHCMGYRQTYDANGNYTETNAVSGFNTIMQYQRGINCGNSGQIYNPGVVDSFITDVVYQFSNPYSTYLHHHPILGTNSNYSIDQTSFWGNSRTIHNDNDQNVRAFMGTPTNLTLTPDMGLKSREYADFIATGSVVITPGFKVAAGSQLKITVGSEAMAKRGIESDHQFAPAEETSARSLGGITELLVVYDQISQSMRLSFSASAEANIMLSLFDAHGKRKVDFGNYRAKAGAFSTIVPIPTLTSGVYFMRVTVGSERLYRQFRIR